MLAGRLHFTVEAGGRQPVAACALVAKAVAVAAQPVKRMGPGLPFGLSSNWGMGISLLNEARAQASFSTLAQTDGTSGPCASLSWPNVHRSFSCLLFFFPCTPQAARVAMAGWAPAFFLDPLSARPFPWIEMWKRSPRALCMRPAAPAHSVMARLASAGGHLPKRALSTAQRSAARVRDTSIEARGRQREQQRRKGACAHRWIDGAQQTRARSACGGAASG